MFSGTSHLRCVSAMLRNVTSKFGHVESHVNPLSHRNIHRSIACLADSYNSCRHYSMYSIKFEKKKAKRLPPPKDETPHLPDYMVQRLPGQQDDEETKKISLDVIQKINKQIEEQSHGRLFAIIQVAGRQFKVTQEDLIVIQGYWAPTLGDRIRFEKILLTGSTDFTVLGRPMLPRDLVRVEGTVIDKSMSYTKLQFRTLRRKNYRRLYFSKISYTIVRINTIGFDEYVNETKDVEGERNTIF